MKDEKNKSFMLLWIPFLTYGFSYLYLAFYHGKLFIFNTVVHEGGSFTLLETIFYASHFLGHLPSLTVIALIFTGSYLLFFGYEQTKRDAFSKLFSWLIIFLVLSFVLSIGWFGWEDTRDYLLQTKQSVERMETGGSWLLHLPSTCLLFFMIPVYLFVIAKLFKLNLDMKTSGYRYLGLAGGLTLIFTWIFTENLFEPFAKVWTDPRYLSHSVRELATFPLTFFPIPLYFLLKNRDTGCNDPLPIYRKILFLITLIFALGFIYQCYVPLNQGIGELAQKPAFAKEGRLGITYLLTAHYFEHVLDTVYFTLICLCFYNLTSKSSKTIDFKTENS